jgi:purine catabolism regulator
VLQLADVLALPVVRGADPDVLAGAGHLERGVRWVHTTELSDIAPLLRGGDLVMTTGIALPEAPAQLAAFAASLADSGAAGLFVELGRRWSEVPVGLVDECERRDLPLVALRREVRFAAVAQAVGELLVDRQLAELRETQLVHETFTELSIAEAGPDEVLDAVQRLAAAPVALESAEHRVLDLRTGPGDPDAFLEDWERRSRRVQPAERTAWDASNGWVVTVIGRRERRWGRLVVGSPAPPSPRLVAVVERAAAALAMHRLHDRSRDSRTRRLHHELVLALLADPSRPEVLRRVELAGLPPGPRPLVGLALRPAAEPGATGGLSAQLDDLVAALLASAETLGVPLLAATFEGDVRALVSLPATGDADGWVDRLVEGAQARVGAVAAAGPAVPRLQGADRTLRDALHVLAAVSGADAAARGVHRLADVHVRGLLMLLSEDERLRGFVQRELAPYDELPERDRADAVRLTRVLVERWGSKSAAAAELNVSRPVLYDRIRRLERLLGRDLDDAEVRTSLHLALLAAELPPHAATIRRAH